MGARGAERRARRAIAALAIAIALAAPGAGCGLAREADRLPSGAYLSADGPALARVLARLDGLAGTPLGRHAEALRARLAGCAAVAGHAPTGGLAALPSALACARPDELGPALRSLRGDADLLLLAPLGAERRAILTGRLEPAGALTLELRLDPPAAEGALSLLLPARDPVGAPVLARADTVLHARVRPREGIDLARLVPEGSQGDRLFRLRSALFSSAVLAGVWELAVYVPADGEALPPMAAALDVQRPALAVEAMEDFLAELAEAWPVHRTAISMARQERDPAGGAGASAVDGSVRTPGEGQVFEGACLLDLRILPAFAPCYVATPRALVIAWNPPSLERALAAGEARDLGEAGLIASHLQVRLDRIAEADRRLRAARGATSPDAARDYGWDRLDVVPGAGEAELRIALASAPPDPGPAASEAASGAAREP